MRVVLAGFFVVTGMLLAAALLLPLAGHGAYERAIAVGIGVGGFMIFLVVAAQVAFNWPVVGAQVLTNNADFIKGLEEAGLLVSIDYHAVHAFQLEDDEDEGPYYFVELTNGGVIYVMGQELFEYEPNDDSPRQFPCTDFSIRSHRDEHYRLDIICRGLAIEPEVIEVNPKAVWARQLQDGEVVTDMSYDEIKAQFMNTDSKP